MSVGEKIGGRRWQFYRRLGNIDSAKLSYSRIGKGVDLFLADAKLEPVVPI